jgi:hypothetical protein
MTRFRPSGHADQLSMTLAVISRRPGSRAALRDDPRRHIASTRHGKGHSAGGSTVAAAGRSAGSDAVEPGWSRKRRPAYGHGPQR